MRQATFAATFAGVLGMSLLLAVPAPAASGNWTGPFALARTTGVAETARPVPLGNRLFFVQTSLDPGEATTSRVAAAELTDGRPGDPAQTRNLGAVGSLRLTSSPAAITAGFDMSEDLRPAGYGPPKYATAEFDGSTWSEPVVHVSSGPVEGGGSLSLGGHGLTSDASGSVTYAWAQSAYTSTWPAGTFTSKFIVRQRIGGTWQEPITLREYTYVQGQKQAQVPSSVGQNPGVYVAGLANGALLVCSDWTVDGGNEPNKVLCWTSPSPGAEWTALPELTYGKGNLVGSIAGVALVGAAEPLLVLRALPLPLGTAYRGGSWTPFAPLAPRPPTTARDPSRSAMGIITMATDGDGNVMVAGRWQDTVASASGYTDDFLMSVQVTAHDGTGWTPWRRVSPVMSSYSWDTINTDVALTFAKGTAVVGWVQRMPQGDSAPGLFVSTMAADRWSNPQRVSALDPSGMGYTLVAGMTADRRAALAWDGSGDARAWSLFGSTITPDQASPSEPAALQARAARGTVTLTWSPPAQGASAVTEYQWRSQLEGAAWSPWKRVAAGAEAREHVVKRIRPKKVYVFQVRAMAGATAGPAATTKARGK